MSRYVLSAKAQFDLRDIWNYSFDSWGVSQAERYIGDLRNAIEGIAENPQRGRPCDEICLGHFKILVGSHVIFYREMGDKIAVVRILHQRRNFRRHL